jgi:hypothetical protein
MKKKSDVFVKQLNIKRFIVDLVKKSIEPNLKQ